METLFRMPKPDLVMITEDLADSDDPLEIYLQRRGWDLAEVIGHQQSISEKLTVNMFSGDTQQLSQIEKTLQDDIQRFFDQAFRTKA